MKHQVLAETKKTFRTSVVFCNQNKKKNMLRTFLLPSRLLLCTNSSATTQRTTTILKAAPDVESVLEAVREDAGETAKYYADKYFDGSETKVNSILWNNLKRFGHVDLDRSPRDGDDNEGVTSNMNSNEPRWFPAARFPRRGPIVGHYREEDNDLSVLEEFEQLEAKKVEDWLDSKAAAAATDNNSNNTNIASSITTEFDTKNSAFVSPPATSVGWGNLANTNSTGFGVRSNSSRPNHSDAQRWKADISKLQRSAMSAPKAPKAPWK